MHSMCLPKLVTAKYHICVFCRAMMMYDNYLLFVTLVCPNHTLAYSINSRPRRTMYGESFSLGRALTVTDRQTRIENRHLSLHIA